MDHPDDDDHAGKNEIKTLLVRHLPAELSPADKEDLLKYFGAESVKVLSNHGPLKHTAFATFRSNNAATKALGRLHQLKILDHTLVVTFAKKEDNFTILKDPPLSDKLKPIKKEQNKHAMQKPKVPVLDNGIAPALGLNYQPNPTLRYLYPPLSPAILTNISHALMTVPKFYVQVLHLMNKMNLPCPFGPVTPRPPLFECLPHAPPMPAPPPFPPDYPPLPERDVDPASEEESEYESEDDEDKERIARLMGLVNQACKRPLRQKTSSKRKKPKIKDLLYAPKLDSQSAPAMQPSDVFEQPNAAAPKKIEFHIGVQEVAAIVEGSEPGQVSQHHESSAEQEMDDDSCKEAPDGFGKLYPSTKASRLQEEGSDEEADLPSDVISRKELEKGRLSKDEMKRMSVYKNYEAGEPTCRLYVKNIAKQVEEKDLKYIYGRYIDLSSEAERNMFDIVLMKEGRMKGQAFVGLPSERSAEKALRDTNGFVLYDRPLVVQFARSARPKPDSADAKKGTKKKCQGLIL